MLPFFLLAPHQTFYDLFIHQLNRPLGINKWNIFSVFVEFEWLLILTSIVGMFKTKNKLWILPLVFSITFFLLYKDLYYLYLHILMPFFVILAVELLEFLFEKQKELFYLVIATFIIIFLYSTYSYTNEYQKEGLFNNPEEVGEVLRNTSDSLPIYGVQEVAPLVALMSKKQIFNNIIDTNTQNFAAGTQDKDKISNEAVKGGIYLVARVGYYPEQNIVDTGFEGYFDKEIFKKYCTNYKSFERPSWGDPLNQITIYHCKENK